MGGQEHFYLEGQAALAAPGEAGQLHRQLDPASERGPAPDRGLLGLKSADVTVEVRGWAAGFGGKETQAAAYAAACALVAAKTGRPAKIRRPRRRHAMTGKRHDFTADYDVGFDGEAGSRASGSPRPRAAAPPSTSASRSTTGRCSTPTIAITPRRRDPQPPAQDPHRLQHRLPRLRRAAGDDGDRAGDRRDRCASRARSARCAPGQSLRPRPRRDALSHDRRGQCRAGADRRAGAKRGYEARRKRSRVRNARHNVLKKGLALTPVKFGISFTTTHLNQAGAWCWSMPTDRST